MAGAVAAPAVAEQQDRTRPGIGRPPLTLPPSLEAVAGELAGVVTGPEVHVALVPLHVVEAVRDDHARGEAGEVVVERLEDPLRQEVTGPVEVADQLLLLRVHA